MDVLVPYKSGHPYIHYIGKGLIGLLPSFSEIAYFFSKCDAKSPYQGTLVLLASITAFERWRLATEFREQLPAAADIFFQPFTAFWQAFEVYRLETAKTTAEVVRMRDKNVEDIQKRNTYRIAHGLQDENEQGLGGWKKASGVVGLGPGAAADEAVRRPVGVEPGQEMEVKGVMRSGDIPEGPVRDPEDRRKPVKKWLGIW